MLATEDAASGTYLPPSSGSDLSWKQTTSLGWQKRQAILNKVKNPKVETLEEKLSKMSRAELEEEYGDVIQAYKRYTNMGQGDAILAKWDMNDLKLLWKRYNEVKDDHLGLLPSELAKVDPKFKKRIDAMDQEALEEAYPELKTLISMAHVNPYAQLFKSETERANYDYLLDRYFLLDSQKMLSWRDPAFQTKYDYYIIEEGIDPFTGKPATQEEINRAKNIKKVRTVTESFQLASTLYTSYVGYNQYYNKPYTTFSDVFSKVKGKIPFFNRNPVIPEVNLKVDINGKTITETTKPYDREHILRNIEESRLARENSGFKDFSTTRLQPVVKPQPAPKNLDVEGPVVNNIQSKYPDLQTYEYNSYTNPGPLNDLRGQPNVNFYGGRYDVEVLKSPKILYRAGDQSNPLGQWFTESAQHSEIEVRINTAVKPIWTDRSGNYTGSSPLNTVYEIKIPAGTTIYRGPVASQGCIYQGGLEYEQIFIETPWKIEGVEVISSKPLN